MNITGRFGPVDDYSGRTSGEIQGCFYNYQNRSDYDATSTTSGSGWKVGFDASRNWTGETSSEGGGAAHNNMPPYLACYVWQRTA